MVNIVGVVAGFRPPVRTRGTGEVINIDYSMSVILTDPSIPSGCDGLTVNMFRRNVEDFPQLQVGHVFMIIVKVS